MGRARAGRGRRLPRATLDPRLCAVLPAPGYGFLPPAQAEMFVRQQELLRKQNLAR
ncbi:Sterile alpha motif domain-containing protein 11 [Saguinus oedipus]|uniref:Sterile alpha motif domain-containing protein 11 n=1 Tax=Saguinus oedipus TaxID=9490 RepID=A0ABQ9V880_SAGOE|nr:Sterile alpha motif domain-containing protein 11 [Saguinus oedipus]